MLEGNEVWFDCYVSLSILFFCEIIVDWNSGNFINL